MARLARLVRLLVPVAAVVSLSVAGSAHAASTLNLSGGVVTFTAGTGDLNSLTISVNGTDILFSGIQTITEIGACSNDTAVVVRCADAAVNSISIDLGDNNDSLRVASTNDPISSADLGSGNDTATLGASSPAIVSGIKALVALDGGSGTDTLLVNDTQDSSDDIVTIASGWVGAAGPGDSFFGSGGRATFTQLETVNITAGVGDSLIKILSSASGATTTIDAGPGDDLFQVSSDGNGSSGHLDGLQGSLSLLGGTGANGLLVSDADAAVGNSAIVTASSINGLAPIPIAYSATGTFSQALVIRGSNSDDTFAVTGSVAGATTDVRTLAGNDTLLISSDGSGVTGALSTLLGGLAVDLGSGSNSLSISDADEATPGANATVTVSPSAIGGLAGPGDGSNIALAASGGAVAAFTLIGSTSPGVAEGYTISNVPGPFTFVGGSGNDSVALRGAAHPVTIQGGQGDDNATLGSTAGTLEDIVSTVTVDGGVGSDSVTLNDTADPSADTVGLAPSAVGSEPGNNLFGPGGSFSHAATEQVSVNLGTGSDSVTISATGAGTSTALNAGAGDDFLFVPGAAANLDSIVSPLTLDGGQGFNALILDDSNDPSGDTATVTESGIGQGPEDTLFGVGGSLNYANFTLLTLNLGTGGDHVLLSGSPAGTIATGAGKDIVELADGASLTGTIDAGDGIDTLSYEAVTTSVSVELSVGAAHGTSGVQSFENVLGGSGSDTLTGLDDARSELSGGKGNDTLVGGTASDLLEGGPGSDQLEGGKGNDTYVVGGGTDVIVDAAGKDTVDLSTARKGVKIDLAKTGKKRQRLGKGVGWIQLLAALENVIGSEFGDRIIGNGLRNVLKGRGGKDALTGAAANDKLIGGAGVDRVVESADKHFTITSKRLAGRGIDTLKSIERATLEGGRSDNKLNASKFKGRVILRGGDGNDRLTGGRQADLLVGEDGDDILTGGKGKDQVIAGPGNDQVFVKDGATDVVDAGIGWDRASTDVADRTRSVEYRLG